MLETLRGAAEKAGFKEWEKLQKALATLPPPSQQKPADGDSTQKDPKQPPDGDATKSDPKPKSGPKKRKGK